MTSNPAPEKHQAPYTRRRDHSQFRRMRRSHYRVRSQEPMFNDSEDLPNSNQLSRSLSDIWELESKQSAAEDGTKKPDELGMKSLPKPIGGDEGMGDDPDEEVKIGKRLGRADGGTKTYYGLSEISLPPSAASYYSGSGQGSRVHDSNPDTCRSMHRLNQYLKDRKMELDAGVPGKFLNAVIGQDAGDVGSVVSTIMYAFYLNENQKSNNNLCTLPVINMKREDLTMHCELKWLLTSCHVDMSSLVFIDEIDLAYFDIFGSLKLVLLNGQNLPSKQEGLKGAVVEIFNCRQDESECSWVEAIKVTEGCSCCALIAEKFVETSPETLAGHGFNRLLLAGILLDTANLSNEQCTSKDRYLATLLLKGAGRLGCNGLYQICKEV